jgi:hypothetical protein
MQKSVRVPNLYFWEPENQNHGILHAVMPWEDCDHVVDRASAIHVGNEFPTRSIKGSGHATLAILYVHPEEANEEWPAGFYRIDRYVTEIHERLNTLKESRPRAGQR